MINAPLQLRISFMGKQMKLVCILFPSIFFLLRFLYFIFLSVPFIREPWPRWLASPTLPKFGAYWAGLKEQRQNQDAGKTRGDAPGQRKEQGIQLQQEFELIPLNVQSQRNDQEIQQQQGVKSS